MCFKNAFCFTKIPSVIRTNVKNILIILRTFFHYKYAFVQRKDSVDV